MGSSYDDVTKSPWQPGFIQTCSVWIVSTSFCQHMFLVDTWSEGIQEADHHTPSHIISPMASSFYYLAVQYSLTHVAFIKTCHCPVADTNASITGLSPAVALDDILFNCIYFHWCYNSINKKLPGNRVCLRVKKTQPCQYLIKHSNEHRWNIINGNCLVAGSVQV